MRNFIYCFFLLIAFKVGAQTTEIDKKWIREEINTSMENNNIPSLSVAIIQNGKIVYKDGFGTISRVSSEQVNQHTIFQIASLSKMLTGVIAKSLVLQGVLDPEKPILNYLSGNKIQEEAKVELEAIKVKQLIHHSSGVPRDSKVISRIDGDPMLGGYSESDLYHDLNNMNLDFEPGSKYSYSNLGYTLLGHILEVASGKSYDRLLNEFIIDKLDLKNTYSSLQEFSSKRLATPYRKDKREVKTKPWETGKFVAASGVFSSASDLIKIMKAQIESYNSDKYEDLILNSSKFNRGESGKFYGFGIFEDKTTKGTFLSHRGDMDGYASEYGFFPGLQVGVVLLSSSGGDWSGELVSKILKRVSDSVLEQRKNL